MAKKVILFRTEHTKRTLVNKVDFITSGGFLETKNRAPTELFTPKGIFTLTKNTPKWKIKSINSGYFLNFLITGAALTKLGLAPIIKQIVILFSFIPIL